MTGLGVIDWNAIAAASNTITNTVQSGVNIYSSIKGATGSSGGSGTPSPVQQYVDTPVAAKSNTTMYIVLGGVGLLAVGAIVFMAVRKKK